MSKGKSNLAGLPYYGGKSPRGTTGPWIASLLPQGKTYVEAFAGMAGVLLCRRRSESEVLNDADGHLVNWWKMIRDEPKELGKLLLNTPFSYEEYYGCWKALMSGELDDDPLERARAYHVCIDQGVIHGLGVGKRGWSLNLDGGGKNTSLFDEERMAALSNRLRRVQLANTDAAELTRKCAKYKGLVLYLDPPYRSADTDGYRIAAFDADELAEAARKCKGFVAISGYNDDWDHLGWHKHRCDTRFRRVGPNPNGGRDDRRTEFLWTNKPAVGVPSRTLMD